MPVNPAGLPAGLAHFTRADADALAAEVAARAEELRLLRAAHAAVTAVVNAKEGVAAPKPAAKSAAAPPAVPAQAAAPKRRGRPPKAKPAADGHDRHAAARGHVAAYLRKHGPSTKGAILADCGLPIEQAADVLRCDWFDINADGKLVLTAAGRAASAGGG